MDRWPQQALEGLLRQMDQIALSQLKDLIGKIRNKSETEAKILPQGQLAILGILLVLFILTNFKWKNRLERNTLMWGPLSSVFTPRWASFKRVFFIQEISSSGVSNSLVLKLLLTITFCSKNGLDPMMVEGKAVTAYRNPSTVVQNFPYLEAKQ